MSATGQGLTREVEPIPARGCARFERPKPGAPWLRSDSRRAILEFLRLPDRFVPHDGAGARRAVERIVRAAREVDAAALFVSWREDPHCDHVAAYHLARAAQGELGVKLYEYSVWGAALGPLARVAPVTAGFRLRTEAHRARKRRAIAAHKSQLGGLIADDPTGFSLSAADLARFSGPFETFIETRE